MKELTSKMSIRKNISNVFGISVRRAIIKNSSLSIYISFIELCTAQTKGSLFFIQKVSIVSDIYRVVSKLIGKIRLIRISFVR